MSNQSYEDFISTVSHELRTPLTSIRGFTQTMLTSWDKLDDENKKKFLKIIEEQSNRLIALVENMLAVTKLQSAKDLMVFKETDISTTVNTVITLLKSKYPEKIFDIKIPSSIPTILADKDKFQQVMMNLIENAAKYSFENTTIEISASYSKKPEYIALNITDVGIKIEQDNYEKIFEKFSRIDNPLTRKAQGSGLGLYITKNIVEKMNGTISVCSEKIDTDKAKTTFTVEFPICNVETQAREKCKQ